MVFYICNRKKCKNCHYTSDISYAVNPFASERSDFIKCGEHFFETFPDGST